MASSRQQCRVFNLIPWKQRNDTTWRISYQVMHVFPQVHIQIHRTRSQFDVFERAQDLKRMTQNRVDFLTIMQLAATFQQYALFSILKFFNVHATSFDRLMANQKWASWVRFDGHVVRRFRGYMTKDPVQKQQPWKRTTRIVMPYIMMYIIIIPCLGIFRQNWVNMCMVYGCWVFLSMLG